LHTLLCTIIGTAFFVWALYVDLLYYASVILKSVTDYSIMVVTVILQCMLWHLAVLL